MTRTIANDTRANVSRTAAILLIGLAVLAVFAHAVILRHTAGAMAASQAGHALDAPMARAIRQHAETGSRFELLYGAPELALP